MSSQPKLLIKSEDERFVMGEVYVANDVDTDGDMMSPAEVRAMAHRFIMTGGYDKIDRQHDGQKSGNLVAESFFVDFPGHPDGWRENSWVMGSYILNDEDWGKVKSGEFNGYSWGGSGNDKPVLAKVKVPIRVIGLTEDFPHSGGHTHEINAQFAPNGALLPSRTTVSDNHSHALLKMTATESDSGHSHRIVVDGS